MSDRPPPTRLRAAFPPAHRKFSSMGNVAAARRSYVSSARTTESASSTAPKSSVKAAPVTAAGSAPSSARSSDGASSVRCASGAPRARSSAFFAMKAAVRARRYGDAPTECSTPLGQPTTTTPRGSEMTGDSASGRQRMGSTAPGAPSALASWSMRPHGAPTT